MVPLVAHAFKVPSRYRPLAIVEDEVGEEGEEGEEVRETKQEGIHGIETSPHCTASQ